MLELADLAKRYDSVQALDGCTFSVGRGRMLGFLGPNGAGKTTAMRAVFGLVRLDRGEVRWDGEPVSPERWTRFGYMPEQRGLYPRMRVRDQLVYFGRLHDMSAASAGAAADRWLAELGLADRAGDRLEQLSHGNQQRVQLAAALLHDPELLVLDEPFSGLDPLGVNTLGAVLQHQARAGKAVVFSSHQLDLVEDLCEDVVTIDRGHIVMAGEVRALKEASPHRRLDIDVDGGNGDWVPDLSGILSTAVDGTAVTMLVKRDVDLEAVLAAARAAGPIRHFSFEAPSLSELFLEAVTG